MLIINGHWQYKLLLLFSANLQQQKSRNPLEVYNIYKKNNNANSTTALCTVDWMAKREVYVLSD